MNPLAPLYQLADRLRYRKHRNLGRHGEDIAPRYLRSRGYIVAARNWRPPQGGGEIALIAWESSPKDQPPCLIFVEVKTRSTGEWSAPERAITPEKINSLRRAARDYIRRSKADPARVRFDVLAIVISRASATPEHLRDVFAPNLSL